MSRVGIHILCCHVCLDKSDIIAALGSIDLMLSNNGSDTIAGGAGNDNLGGREGIVNNDRLDGGSGSRDLCDSDPDPEANCEI
ncbi:MAG TPA: hypothetical protein VGE97_10495 [Nitrososphaera sp.]|jgi:hypothetical protein